MDDITLLKFIRDMKKTALKHSDPIMVEALTAQYEEMEMTVKGEVSLSSDNYKI